MKYSLAFVGLLTLAFLGDVVCADDALVLPKGRFRVRLVTSFSSIENNFGNNGEILGLGSSFTKRLDSKLLSALNPGTADTIKKLNSVSPGLGDEIAVDLSTKVDTQILSNILALEYGLTDRVSIGFILPVVHAEVNVDANASPDEALNSKINAMSDADPRKAILKQVQGGLNVQTFDSMLRDQYNYRNGLQSWSGAGLGDLELGGKYNYYKSPQLLSTLKAGVRLPTGRVDDPNILFDLGFGDGQVDLGLFNMVDYKFTRDFGATLEVGYTFQLPDTSDVRVPLSDEIPINSLSQKISRKLGDLVNAELEANYQFFKRLTVSARYRYFYKMQDSFSGTSEEVHAGAFNVEFTNLTDVRAGRSKFPYSVAGFFRMPFAGKNVADSRTTGVALKTYF